MVGTVNPKGGATTTGFERGAPRSFGVHDTRAISGLGDIDPSVFLRHRRPSILPAIYWRLLLLASFVDQLSNCRIRTDGLSASSGSSCGSSCRQSVLDLGSVVDDFRNLRGFCNSRDASRKVIPHIQRQFSEKVDDGAVRSHRPVHRFGSMVRAVGRLCLAKTSHFRRVNDLKIMVGERGFEPPTPWSRTRNRLANLLPRLGWLCVVLPPVRRFSAAIGPKLDPTSQT